MNTDQVKEEYSRFKQWQEQPFDYTYDSERSQHCNNCGHEFTGNYCPVCSQKAGAGRIGWRSVHQGIMDIWGLGTRSLLYSIWQLLWRPGHIIGDYIDGKRQVSFPPVKMLFIVAVLFSMIYYWFLPTVLGINFEAEIPQDERVIMGDFADWLKTNYSWFALIMAMLAVVPTWIMFRYSPRHTRHTMPEGFFIQVFLAVLMIVFSFLLLPLAMLNVMAYTYIVYCFYGVYYIIVYKYLFGYSLWGTLWRSGFVLLTIVLLMTLGVILGSHLIEGMMKLQGNVQMTEEQAFQAKAFATVGLAVSVIVVMAVGFIINRLATRKFRKELKLNASR
ncbi:MAG: DUF3667 domain-containing protein [Muribaculaceae bacterium]|nr:DUF3667 domain-containing protein [Muribaculaceae bacterium]